MARYVLEPVTRPSSNKGVYLEALKAFMESDEDVVKVSIDGVSSSNSVYAGFVYNVRCRYEDKVRIIRSKGDVFLTKV